MKQKAVLITGAGKRMGRLLAQTAGTLGYGVVAHYRGSKKEIDTLGKTLKPDGVPFFPIQWDLSKNTDKFMAACREFPVRLCGLVNNASVFEKGNWASKSFEVFFRQLNINALTPLRLSRAFAGSREGEFIINLLDANVQGFDPAFQNYRFSKKMLFEITRDSARLFAPNIRVNGIAPGAFLPSPHDSRDTFIKKAAKAPLKKPAKKTSFSRAFEYLVRDTSLTGQVLYVDGGIHLK